MNNKYVVVSSGGLDSTTLLHKTYREAEVSSVVSFNYGQKHGKELQYAQHHAEMIGVEWHLIDLSQSGLAEAMASSHSSLVTDEEVPEGHYAQDNMKSTVVPNRNMFMLAMAISIAVSEGATHVATGVHGGDHFIYPDCRPQFIQAASLAGIIGNEGFGNFKGIWAPYLDKTKTDIAYEAFMLGVPIDLTWSCYKGGEKHCGRCGTCVERLEAISEARGRLFSEYGMQREDPTEYEDKEYWLFATREAAK